MAFISRNPDRFTKTILLAIVLLIIYYSYDEESEVFSENISSDGIKTVSKSNDSNNDAITDDSIDETVDKIIEKVKDDSEPSSPASSSSPISTDELPESLLEANEEPITFSQLYDNLPTREYAVWTDDFPCYFKRFIGIQYIKIKKCASTTSREITQRIAYRKYQEIYNDDDTEDDDDDDDDDEDDDDNNRRYLQHALQSNTPLEYQEQNQRDLDFLRSSGNRPACNEFSQHKPAYKAQRNGPVKFHKMPHILYSFVREPTSRYLSHFFYHSVSYRNITANLDNFQLYTFPNKVTMDSPDISEIYFSNMGGYQLNYLTWKRRYIYPNMAEWTYWSPSDPTHIHNITHLQFRVNELLDTYSFLGVVERYDESLVVMTFLFQLSLGDVLYWTNRASGGYDFRNKKCVSLTKSFQSPDMKEYFDSDEWKARMAGDFLLYQSAYESLDRTIDGVIGRTRFEERLKEFQYLLKLVEEECQGFEECDENGEVRDGFRTVKNKHYTCMDDVYDNYLRKERS